MGAHPYHVYLDNPWQLIISMAHCSHVAHWYDNPFVPQPMISLTILTSNNLLFCHFWHLAIIMNTRYHVIDSRTISWFLLWRLETCSTSPQLHNEHACLQTFDIWMTCFLWVQISFNKSMFNNFNMMKVWQSEWCPKNFNLRLHPNHDPC